MIRGRPFYVVGAGCVVRRRGGRLEALKDGELRASAPLTRISEVVATGRVTVSTPALHALLAHDVPLILLTGSGRPLGRLEPPGAPHILARRQQLALHADPDARLRLGRAVIGAKIRNQRVLLRRRARGDATKDAAALRRLAELQERAKECADIPQLLGVEGLSAGVYYRALREQLDPRFGFTERDRHGRDVVNALTNYCSALLRETIISALLAAGLDPYVSFLHVPMRARPTLAFDLMEEWRPVLLDSSVLALLGLGAVTPDDVEAADDGRILSAHARAQAVSRFHARLAASARSWPPLPPGRRYGDQVRAQALALRGWILGESADYPPFHWR